VRVETYGGRRKGGVSWNLTFVSLIPLLTVRGEKSGLEWRGGLETKKAKAEAGSRFYISSYINIDVIINMQIDLL